MIIKNCDGRSDKDAENSRYEKNNLNNYYFVLSLT